MARETSTVDFNTSARRVLRVRGCDSAPPCRFCAGSSCRADMESTNDVEDVKDTNKRSPRGYNEFYARSTVTEPSAVPCSLSCDRNKKIARRNVVVELEGQADKWSRRSLAGSKTSNSSLFKECIIVARSIQTSFHSLFSGSCSAYGRPSARLRSLSSRSLSSSSTSFPFPHSEPASASPPDRA